MKNLVWKMGPVVLALLATACSGGNDDTIVEDPPAGGEGGEFLAGLPELGALELSITGDAQAEALASDDDAIGAVAAEALGSAELALVAPASAEGLERARDAVRDLNRGLRNFLEPIAALARNVPPDEIEANVAMWGPVTRGATEYRLFVKKGLLRRYGWLLQARPGDVGEGEAYANVAAGTIQVGAVVRRGRGTVGVDLDALGDVDPTVAARGKILAGFAHGPRGTVLAYGLKEFSKDGVSEPIDAAFQGVHLEAGHNRVRLAYRGDVAETASDAEELVLARVRHLRGEGGRADLIAVGGDIPEGRAWVVSECWGGGLAAGYRIVLDCPGDGPGGERCEVHSQTGNLASCLADFAEAELPPPDPEAPMADPESPETGVTIPEELPDGEAPAN